MIATTYSPNGGLPTTTIVFNIHHVLLLSTDQISNTVYLSNAPCKIKILYIEQSDTCYQIFEVTCYQKALF